MSYESLQSIHNLLCRYGVGNRERLRPWGALAWKCPPTKCSH